MQKLMIAVALLSGSVAQAGIARPDVGDRAVVAIRAAKQAEAAKERAAELDAVRARQEAVLREQEAKRDAKRATTRVYDRLRTISQRADVKALQTVLGEGGGRILLGDVLGPRGSLATDILTLGPKGFGILRAKDVRVPYDTRRYTFFGRLPLKRAMGLLKRQQLGELDMTQVERRLDHALGKLATIATKGEMPEEWRHDLTTTRKAWVDLYSGVMK